MSAELKREQIQFIHYRGTGRQTIERRRDMAKGLGLTLDALGTRASRIRRSLEACAASEGCST